MRESSTTRAAAASGCRCRRSPWWRKALRALPYLVGFGVILFLLIGYLGKKKLRLKHMAPQVVNMNVRPRKTLNVKLQKVWWELSAALRPRAGHHPQPSAHL